MSKFIKRKVGDRINLYLNEEISEQGLALVNRLLMQNKLSPTIVKLLNKAAEEEELQNLGKSEVASAKDNNTGQSNNVLRLLVQLVQNGQLVLNTGQVQPNTQMNVENTHQYNQKHRPHSKYKQETEERNSYQNDVLNDEFENDGYKFNLNSNDDNVSSVIVEVDNNEKEVINPNKPINSNDIVNNEVTITNDSPTDSNTNTDNTPNNNSGGLKVGRRRSLNNYKGQMTKSIK